MNQLKILIFVITTCIFTNIAHADGSEKAVEEFVTSVSSDVINILNDKHSESSIQSKLTDKFHNTVDINWISKFVIGKHWTTLSTEQKHTYMDNYKKFLTASYVPIFKDYNGQKIKVLGVKYIGSGYYIVRTSIVRENSTVEYIVEYRVKDLDGKYKIRDIIAEGVSMISTQRSEFSSVMTSGGLEGLNNQLVEKAANLNN